MSQKKRSKRWLWIVLLVPALGGLAYFSVKAVGTAPAKIPPEKLARVERGNLTRSVVATGKIEAATKVEIKSKASGIIQSLPVDIGQVVRQGQVICELDQNDLLPRVREAEAALANAEAVVESAKAELERYKVEALGPDLPFLERDMKRARQLFGDGLIAQQARDEAEKAYEMALNRQKSALVNLGVARAAVAKSEANLEQARAIVDRVREDLRNATIVSPINGVVLSRDREVGDAVSSILTMGAGATLIMTVGNLSEVYVKGKVDESDLGKVYIGQPARISVEAYKDHPFTGKVTMISPMGVEKDNVTTFEVRVSISNESGKLRALMTANAEIIMEEKTGVLVMPESAIIYTRDRKTEAEIPDPSAKTGVRRVAIQTGISNGSRTEVVGGLGEGQQVILR
ncbi:MAG: efflux RND transporter periplasmic adaptor subunit [Bryobacterales bacterium]|nr:efflux RND transporter periplasmic adaptor subunit [Bryobacterales bacterium]